LIASVYQTPILDSAPKLISLVKPKTILVVSEMVKIYFSKGLEPLCEIDTFEDLDWDYARNKQVLLKDGLVEYSTSSFDAPIATPVGVLHGGNRDFSWQGLLVGPIGDSIYKVLDAIYYKPLDSQELKPVRVVAGRNAARYSYVDEQGRPYEVEISVRTKKDSCLVMALASRPSIFAPLFAFYDMESSTRAAFRMALEGGAMRVEPEGMPLKLLVKDFLSVTDINLELDWIYKLGDGFRTIRDGKVFFVRHVRRASAPVALTSKDGSISIEIPLDKLKFKRIDYKARGKLEALRKELSERARGKIPPEVVNAIVLRVDRLLSFGIPSGSILVPEAGSMWFRKVWARDLIEGLKWNLLTYAKVLNLSDWLIRLVRDLISTAYDLRGLRVFVNKGDFVSGAVPQLISISAKLYELTHDKKLVKEASKLASATCKLLRSEEGFSGCKVRDGLVLSKANSSWMDVLYEVEGAKWPLRLPWSWRTKFSSEDLFALVEVNALFIEGLDSLFKAMRETGLKGSEKIKELRDELVEGYKKWFYVADRLPPMTVEPSTGARDWTPSSASVAALALLKNLVYEANEISRAWEQIEEMIVKRKLICLGSSWEVFGIVARKVEERPYLGDLEYHGPVVWPRDTPYLIEVMKCLGFDAYGVLVNNLDHMISEGAIGYVSELFSLPVGLNPHESGERSRNPVPVKNYAQYWSHWCDPYIEYFMR
jgi:hypothetical protein